MTIRSTCLAAAGAAGLMLAAAPAVAQDWNGFYFGGHLGYGKLSDRSGETVLFDTNLDGSFGDTVNTPAGANAFSPGFCDGAANGNNAGAGCGDDDDSGLEYGARLGFDWQMGGWVFGAVGEYARTDFSDSVTAFSVTPANYTFTRELDHVWAVRGRVGYDMGGMLPYVTAGWARGKLDSTYQTSNAANSFSPLTQSLDADGYQIGAGIETRVGANMTLGLEYLYTELDADAHVVRVGPGTAPPTNPFLLVNAAGTDNRRSNDSVELHAIRLTAAWRF